MPVFSTANFSSSRLLSNTSVSGGGGSGSEVGVGELGSSEMGLSSFETSMDFEVNLRVGWCLLRRGGKVRWEGFGFGDDG